MLRCRLRFCQRIICLAIIVIGAALIITYRYHELRLLRSDKFLQIILNKEKENEELTSNNPVMVKKMNHSAVNTGTRTLSVTSAWHVWRTWPQSNELYTEKQFNSSEMKDILHHMATASIVRFDVGHKGTQLKALVELEGGQLAVFKPKRYNMMITCNNVPHNMLRYERDYVVPGEPYAGFDLHTAEIVGFYLDSLLGFRLAPPVVGRVIDLNDIKHVTSQKLLETYFMKGDNICFYGRCYYCKPAEAACANGSMMEGSLTLWLPDHMSLRTWRHPYQRTYRDQYKARWEVNPEYCKNEVMTRTPYSKGPRLLDIMDTTVLDYLMGNADRHHYETVDDGDEARLLHLDNGKSFRDPSKDEATILAPLEQCCRIRNSTWNKLLSLTSQGLSRMLDRLLQTDPIYPILTRPHLQSIDRRHYTLIDVINKCIKQLGASSVIINEFLFS